MTTLIFFVGIDKIIAGFVRDGKTHIPPNQMPLVTDPRQPQMLPEVNKQTNKKTTVREVAFCLVSISKMPAYGYVYRISRHGHLRRQITSRRTSLFHRTPFHACLRPYWPRLSMKVEFDWESLVMPWKEAIRRFSPLRLCLSHGWESVSHSKVTVQCV